MRKRELRWVWWDRVLRVKGTFTAQEVVAIAGAIEAALEEVDELRDFNEAGELVENETPGLEG